MLYTCYSADKKHKFEEYQTIETKINNDFIKEYGIDTTSILIEEYKKKQSKYF